MIFGLFGKKTDQREKELIGEVVHYFGKVKVVVIKLKKGKLAAGDEVWFKGHTTDFSQKVQSMEIDHNSVESVSKGDEVAIKAKGRARTGDQVFVVKGK